MDEQANSVLATIISIAIGGAITYWIWPVGITDLPLAQITFGALLRVIASCITSFITFMFVAHAWE